MAIRAAELEVVIGANTNPAVQGIRKAMGQIQNAGMSAFGIFTGQLLYNAVQQAGQAIIGLGSDALQATVSWEQLGFSIKSLMANELMAKDSTLSMADALKLVNSASQDTLQWIQKLGIASPFPTETVAQVFQMQMRMGATSDQAKILTKSLLDMAAATGLTSENLAGAGLALSQIAGSTKLSAQDLRQLINAGIPVNDILKKMGLTWEDVGKKSIKGQEFIDAFISESNKFSGSVDNMHGSWTAMLGALGDVKKIGLRTLFAGVFDALQPVVSKFTDWMMGPGLERLSEIGKKLGDFTKHLIDIGQALFTAGLFSEQFSNALSALSPTLGDLWAKIAPFIQQGLQWISENKDAIIAALTGMAVAFGALTIIGAIAGLISALSNPITLIIALAGLLAVAWQQDWGGIQEKTAAVWAWLQPILAHVVTWLRTNIPVALQTLKNIWSAVWSGIQAVVSAVLPVVMGIVRAFQAAMRGDWYAFGANLRQAWDAVWKLLAQIVSTAWARIKAAVVAIIRNTISVFTTTNWTALGKAIIDGLIAGVKNGVGALENAVKKAAQAALNAAKGFLKIQSPSKLFRDEIAGNIIKGWAHGIQARIPQLESAMTFTAGRMAFAAQPVQPARTFQPAGVGAATFYAPVTFRVENGQTMRDVLRELRK
jgi:tape measure domain-containing protein